MTLRNGILGPGLGPTLALVLAASSLVGLTGCGARGGVRGPALHGERGPAENQVSDDGFAAAVHDLLVTDPGTPERAVRLRAVESRQMTRASERFKAHAGERGLGAVNGGLYLLRAGEPVQGIFGPEGPDALKGAARELALKGDEGRARAVYDLWSAIAPDADKADIRAHIDALDAWTRQAVTSGGPVASAGGLERVAVHRRMLEPTKEALADAANATSDWIANAVVLRDKFRKNRVQPPREEGAEAWRALETGPAVLAAIYLRDGDAAGALAAIDRAQARELLTAERPAFATALEAAAQEPSVDRCIDLLHQLRPMTGREATRESEDFADDRDVFGAAAFGMAAECYRLDPTVPEVALTLGVGLAELGMAEATPAVLVDALRAHPEVRLASEALSVARDVVAAEEDSGDPDAARRAYHAAQPLLTLAGDAGLAGKVQPSPARIRAIMGEIELREGRIDDARTLFTQSASEEKLGGVLLSLARIEWRDGHAPAALDHLRDAVSAHDVSRDPALRGEILLTISDVTHDQGDAAAARTPSPRPSRAWCSRATCPTPTRAPASSEPSRACSTASVPTSRRSAPSSAPTPPPPATSTRRRRPSSRWWAARSCGATWPPPATGCSTRCRPTSTPTISSTSPSGSASSSASCTPRPTARPIACSPRAATTARSRRTRARTRGRTRVDGSPRSRASARASSRATSSSRGPAPPSRSTRRSSTTPWTTARPATPRAATICCARWSQARGCS